MAVRRQKNWLGQQRVDTTHLREIESAVVGDFDDLAGKVLASSRPVVVSGFAISMTTAVGGFATQLVMTTAGGILLHGTASEPGAIFVVPVSQPAETLSTSNAHVVGSFTPNAINYIGLDLVRAADPVTADIVKFRSATTRKEFTQQAPLARTLQYRIIISTSDFDTLTNVAPVAKVQLDTNGLVTSVTDCRELMFRLGTGGSAPNALAPFSWPGGRVENPITSTDTTDPFSGADKSIASFIDFFHAMESRLWEVGGGEHWYSQTTDRDVLFVRDSTNVFAPLNDNFEWTGTNLHWKGLSFDFGNSTSTRNTINQQLVDSAGLTDLAVGQCIYVDVNRAVDGAALTPLKANLSSLGTPTIPGSRHIIAWRVTEGVFGLGQATPVGFATPHATDLAYGIVRLYADAGTDAVVPAVDTNGLVVARGMTRDTAGLLTVGGGANDTSVTVGSSNSTATGLVGNVVGGTSSLPGADAGTNFVFEASNVRTNGNLLRFLTAGVPWLSVDYTVALALAGTIAAAPTLTNLTALTGTGTGTGAGVEGTGGATGPGVKANGNAARGSVNMPQQTAPTTPADGDVWTLTAYGSPACGVPQARLFDAASSNTHSFITDRTFAQSSTATAAANWTVNAAGMTRLGKSTSNGRGVTEFSLDVTAGVGAGATICTLPAGFRPGKQHELSGWDTTANAAFFYYVSVLGDVVARNGVVDGHNYVMGATMLTSGNV